MSNCVEHTPPPEPTDEMIKLGIEAYKITKKTICQTGGNTYKLSPEQRMRNAYILHGDAMD